MVETKKRAGKDRAGEGARRSMEMVVDMVAMVMVAAVVVAVVVVVVVERNAGGRRLRSGFGRRLGHRVGSGGWFFG